ncbi:hypothetical protein KSP40_PGU019876 [Platanthera guangdongensis]|uniref:Uncharacterized protein n=1 Tax=Platanthera guangdongensis TaxID=2320717 RepID=A0ABR2M1G9_9ASPA
MSMAPSRLPSSATPMRPYSTPTAMQASTRQTNSPENIVASPSSYKEVSMVPELRQFHCDFMNNRSKRPHTLL